VGSTVQQWLRQIPLSGCFNFRDLGGYPTTDGRSTRWKTVFRADGLARLDAQDCRILAQFGLSTVIDLRTHGEVDERGRIPGDILSVEYHHLPMYDVLPPDDELARYEEPAFVTERYHQMFAEGRPAIAKAIEILSRPNSLPAVFHCSAGKDRTGVLAALLLGFLGVPVEVIAEDYALSGEAMVTMLAWLRNEHPDRRDALERLAPAVTSAPHASMAAFLDRLVDEHGSFASLAEELGVSEPVNQLRTVLLEDPH
jgi:protein-tyrosine phosphatase